MDIAACKKLLAIAGKILFPPFCVHCAREGAWLCSNCEEKLVPFPQPVCPLCAIRMPDGRLTCGCSQKTRLTRFLCGYPLKNSVARALVYTYKYRHGAMLHGIIFSLMQKWLSRHYLETLFSHQSSFIVIPVPLHTKRLNQRGFNQAELLAKDFSSHYRLSIKAAVLARIKHTQSQVGVQNREAREKNMECAFAVTDALAVKGMKIILVDDVYTSGATMRACSIALRSAGALEVWGLTFARD